MKQKYIVACPQCEKVYHFHGKSINAVVISVRYHVCKSCTPSKVQKNWKPPTQENDFEPTKKVSMSSVIKKLAPIKRAAVAVNA